MKFMKFKALNQFFSWKGMLHLQEKVCWTMKSLIHQQRRQGNQLGRAYEAGAACFAKATRAPDQEVNQADKAR